MWRRTSAEGDLVKRVIGVGGDTVACCDTQDRVTVNGTPIDEAYLYPGDSPGDAPPGCSGQFEVSVPAGYLWVMGDHRSVSEDSRCQDGLEQFVPEENLHGRTVAVVWPLEPLVPGRSLVRVRRRLLTPSPTSPDVGCCPCHPSVDPRRVSSWWTRPTESCCSAAATRSAQVPRCGTPPAVASIPARRAEHAALRELAEEIGLALTAVGPLVWTRRFEFSFDGVQYDQDEVFYFVRVDSHDVDDSRHTPLERRYLSGHRWFSVAELEALDELVAPPDLAEQLRELLREGPPASPVAVGPAVFP